jgi:hypothetical protein
MKSLILLPRAEVDLIDAAIWYETERAGLGRAFEVDFEKHGEVANDDVERIGTQTSAAKGRLKPAVVESAGRDIVGGPWEAWTPNRGSLNSLADIRLR